MSSDPALLYLTAQHREALAGLTYGLLARKGLLVLTGQAGTGKTTLLARTTTSLAGRLRTALISNPILTPAEFLEAILLGFSARWLESTKPKRLSQLEAVLVQAQAEGRIPVLLVDEAHQAGSEVLEEIRLLGNMERSGEKLLQIVLAGQPELDEKLNGEQMRPLRERIALRLSLRPLSPVEVEEYVQFRWRQAGGGEPPFAPQALALIALWSRGIPRLVNAICDNALITAVGEQARVVQTRQVTESCADLHLLGPELVRPRAPEADVPAPAAAPLPTLQRYGKRSFWGR